MKRMLDSVVQALVCVYASPACTVCINVAEFVFLKQFLVCLSVYCRFLCICEGKCFFCKCVERIFSAFNSLHVIMLYASTVCHAI